MQVASRHGKLYVVERLGATSKAIWIRLHEIRNAKGLVEGDHAEPVGKRKFRIEGKIRETELPVEAFIACTYCGAASGEPCVNRQGKPLRYSHERRGKIDGLG